ncbi:serine hydrolase domain-containing protein [Flagellimonas eckloniae]|uniref:serine hydrolase domain-containing protein n=1 Tax=Flagellimonas eckloniae TaxID=346185 RepID=UPI0006DD0E41|nr:serine hydrolase domain-containing protein [Allomuricauda eckloniae]
MKNIGVSLLKLFLLLSSIYGFSQDKSGDLEKAIDNLFSSYTTETPGVAVAIVKDTTIVFKKGYGQATLEYDIPITPKTIFHVASVSKQFTAFAIYLLEKKGKLSFEDDVRTYLPELPDYHKIIRIKHLLSHTSGLRDQWALLTLAGWSLEDVITTEQILGLAYNQKGLNFESGTAFGYCNTGYTILAKIVEKISGQSFAVFTKQNIFQPLKMGNTQFYDDYQKVVENRAYSYEIKNGNYIKKELNYSNVGPTSLFTTVEDLAKWANNFDNPIVGDIDLFKEFNKVSNLENGNAVIYRQTKKDTLYHAKGQLIWKYKDHKLISHGGHDAGFRAFLARFPEDDWKIITLSNDEHYNILKNGFQIADLFLGKRQAENYLEKPLQQPKAEVRPKFTSNFKEFKGLYASNELQTSYEIDIENNMLVLKHHRLGNMKLTQTGEADFIGNNYFNFQLTFLKEAEKVIGFSISNFGVKNLLVNKISD